MGLAQPLPHPVSHPIVHLGARFRRFLASRLPERDVTLLTQRNVYILPTPPGFTL